MTDIVRARVEERLLKLRMRAVAQRLDGILSAAARAEPTYLDFLDQFLAEETEAKQKKRVAMGIQIAHFPTVKTLDDFDFKFQPSIDAKLVRELATGRFIAGAENVLMFGPPGVGKTHLAIALGRAAVESGHSTLFVTATSRSRSSRVRSSRASSPIKLRSTPSQSCSSSTSSAISLSRNRPRTCSSSSSVAVTSEGSVLITTNQTITQ